MQCPLCNYMLSAFDKDCPRCHGKGINRPSNPSVPPTSPNSSTPVASPPHTAWYYSHQGQRLGPLSYQEIGQLVGNNVITSQTLVWCAGLPDWSVANSTALAPLFTTNRTAPPPLAGTEVNNNIVWTLAFAPLLGFCLMHFLAGFFNTSAGNFWWTTLVLNIFLCFLDENKLKSAGHDTNGMGIWAFLFIPAYLFVRASRLNQNNSYAIVWCVTFFISLTPNL